MKFFNEYKRQLITLAVIALAVISFFTAGSRINAGFLGDAAGFVITPLQGAVASVTGLGERLGQRNRPQARACR